MVIMVVLIYICFALYLANFFVDIASKAIEKDKG